MVTATGIFVGEPSVVEQEHIDSQFLSLTEQIDQLVFVEVEISRFPVIQKGHPVSKTVFNLVFPGPVVEIPGGFTGTRSTVSENKFRCTEYGFGFQRVFGSMGVYAGDNP